MTTQVIMNRDLDFEGKASVDNVLHLSITQAATEATHAVRKGEMDAALASAIEFQPEDLTNHYAGSDGIFIDDTNGFIGINPNSIQRNKLALDVLDEITAKTSSVEYAVVWGTPDVDGISTCIIDTSTDFGTKEVSVRLMKDLGDGFFEHVSTSAIELASSATSVRIRTDSGSVLAATLVAHVTGVSQV